MLPELTHLLVRSDKKSRCIDSIPCCMWAEASPAKLRGLVGQPCSLAFQQNHMFIMLTLENHKRRTIVGMRQAMSKIQEINGSKSLELKLKKQKLHAAA